MNPSRMRSQTAQLPQHVKAFSLAELLVVLTFVSFLMAMAAPALVSNQRAANLTQAGNRLADLITMAKQTSLSRNVMTAVLLVTDTADATLNGRVVGLLEMGSDHVWRQTSGWIYLPVAVEVQDVNGTAPYNALPMPVGASEVQLAPLKGDSDPIYSALVFYPDGRMRGDGVMARQVRVQFRTDMTNPSPANYYDLVLSTDTATVRIQRP